MNNTVKHIILFLFLFFGITVSAQKNKRKVLEARKTQLKKDIVYLNALRSNNARKEKSLLKEVNNLNEKINIRSKLIETIEDEKEAITDEIYVNSVDINNLKNEISKLKKEYSKLLFESYKSKSQQNRMMFILSSSNFNQAYKRFQYLKQYNTFRKNKAEKIQETALKIKVYNDSLKTKKEQKEIIVNENLEEQKKIKKDKSKQEKLISKAQAKQNKYLTEIKKRQKQQQRVDRQIENLIKTAIVSSNTKKGTTKTTSTPKKATKFALTPDAKILANKFTTNKGKLPWPVEKGVVTMRYGTQPHPIVKSLKIQSNGVRITTEKGMKARAIFDGVILAIRVSESTGIKTVMIQHGNYITVYENLSTIIVKKGDKVNTKQTIGTIHTDAVNNETILKFQLWKESKKQNPSPWINKM